MAVTRDQDLGKHNLGSKIETEVSHPFDKAKRTRLIDGARTHLWYLWLLRPPKKVFWTAQADEVGGHWPMPCF